MADPKTKSPETTPEAAQTPGKGQWCSLLERWCLALGGVAGVCPVILEEAQEGNAPCDEAATAPQAPQSTSGRKP